MSVAKSIIGCNLLSGFPFNSSGRKQSTRSSSLSSSKISIAKNRDDQVLFLGKQGLQYIIYTKNNDKNRTRRFNIVRNVVQPGAPPPSQPPFNFLNWVVGVVATVVLPFISYKWSSLLKIKTEVDTAVQRVEDIIVAVEKVAEEVEKVAEDISDDLPEGGKWKEAVDFVENVAERASKDAQLVEDFINKVQEAEEKVEDCVESLGERQAALEPLKEEDIADDHHQEPIDETIHKNN